MLVLYLDQHSMLLICTVPTLYLTSKPAQPLMTWQMS